MEYERKSPCRPHFAWGLPSLFNVCVREKSKRADAGVFVSDLGAARDLPQAAHVSLTLSAKATVSHDRKIRIECDVLR